jgi:hypothetical protein
MKKRNYALVAWLCSILVLAAILVVAGCEASSPGEMALTVTPDYVTLSVGQSVTLTAAGWNAYRWYLSNSSIGILSSTVGEQVVYQAIGGGATQTITVTAIGTGGGTNSTSIATGRATIVQE